MKIPVWEGENCTSQSLYYENISTMYNKYSVPRTCQTVIRQTVKISTNMSFIFI